MSSSSATPAELPGQKLDAEDAGIADKSVVARATNAAKLAWQFKYLGPVVAYSALKYYTVGPPHQAWSLKNALFIDVIHAVGGVRGKDQESDKIDPVRATQAGRKRIAALELHKPKNGVCHEISIPVQKHDLPGLLSEADSKEDGTRKVGGEWQAHSSLRGKQTSKVLFYIHGGGYTVMNPKTHRALTLLMSKSFECRVFSVDYRLAPEGPFPAGLHDSIIAWLYLTNEMKIDPKQIIVAGDSAGGGMVLALMLYLTENNLPAPSGSILLSPWCDLSASLASWDSNLATDYLAMPPTGSKLSPPVLYCTPEKYDELVTHPYISSAIAPLELLCKLPPLLIQVGGAETLRDESTLLAQRCDRAGVDVTHEILSGGCHVSQFFVKDEISISALKAMKIWIDKKGIARGPAINLEQVDSWLEQGWKAQDSKLAAGTTGQKQRQEIPAPWIFEAVEQNAPKIEFRQASCHDAVKQAVDENHQHTPRKGLTVVYEPKRNPAAQGIVGKVFGRLHL